MNPQTNVSQKPTPIMIIGLLLIVIGALGLLGFIVMEVVLLMATAGYASEFSTKFLLAAIPGIFSVTTIFAGVGLRKMKKWSLYLLILISVYMIVEPIRNIVVGAWSNGIFIVFLITVGITLYCWSKKALFS